jgi:hypothetical protein
VASRSALPRRGCVCSRKQGKGENANLPSYLTHLQIIKQQAQLLQGLGRVGVGRERVVGVHQQRQQLARLTAVRMQMRGPWVCMHSRRAACERPNGKQASQKNSARSIKATKAPVQPTNQINQPTLTAAPQTGRWCRPPLRAGPSPPPSLPSPEKGRGKTEERGPGGRGGWHGQGTWRCSVETV